MEKRVKIAEGDLSKAQEKVANAEQAQHSAEAERDELHDEIDSANSKM